MELQVQIPCHPPEPPSTAFDFHIQHTVGSSHCSSPANSAGYLISAPSSPPLQSPPSHSLNLCFYSAPASPTAARSSSIIIPFNWEAIPGVPKPFNSESDSTHCNPDDDNDDFEFDFSGQLVNHPPSTISAADELFHGGKIRPLKPPPGLQPNTIAHTHHYLPTSPPRSPRSPVAKFRGAFSPRRRKEEQEREKGFLDPFETALERTRKSDFSAVEASAHRHHHHHNATTEQRGRTASKNSNINNPRKGISRSLSPLRVTEFALLMQQQQQEEEDERHQQQQPLNSSNYGSYSSNSSSSSSSSWSKSYRNWRLKDFFLFRSASEGRATGKSDPLKKYYHNNTATNPPRKMESDMRSSSILSDHGVGSTSSRRRTAPVMSGNEVPYTANRNRLISEELKRKTSLPYKYGLLGCLGFNPVSSGFGFQDVSSRGFGGGSSSFLRQ